MKTAGNGQQQLHSKQACRAPTVVTSHKPKSVINKMSSKTNKATRNRIRSRHLSNTVVHQTQEASIDRVREEQAARTALVETAADADEEGSSDGAADGHELDLSVSESPVQVVVVLDDVAILVAVGLGDWAGRHEVVDLLAVFERCHVGVWRGMDGRRSRRRHTALYINAMVFDFWRIQPSPEAIDSRRTKRHQLRSARRAVQPHSLHDDKRVGLGGCCRAALVAWCQPKGKPHEAIQSPLARDKARV
jgi:hypothetical protein